MNMKIPPKPLSTTPVLPAGATNHTEPLPASPAFAALAGMPVSTRSTHLGDAVSSVRPRISLLSAAAPAKRAHIPPTMEMNASKSDGFDGFRWASKPVWVGSKKGQEGNWVEPEKLSKGTIAQMQKALGVQPIDLPVLEAAVSRVGAGQLMLYSNISIEKVIQKLGYTTPQGMLVLCEVADERAAFMAMSARENGEQIDNLEEMRRSPLDQAVEEAIDADVPLADIINNPDFGCTNTTNISLVCDMKIERDQNLRKHLERSFSV
jgi:hypothetical protein